MKIFKDLFFTVAAFFIFSCTQLNLKNPVGAVNVSLPSSSRMIIEEGQTVNSFEKINYLISLYSSSGALVDKKMAPEGSSVTFPDVAVGSYVVKAFCYVAPDGKEECIAAGVKTAEVKSGEVTPVNLELLYNRPSRIDLSRTSIKYSGRTEFPSMDEMMGYVDDSFKNFLSAEIVFTNGWSETVVDADRFFVEKNQVSQIPGGTFATGGTGGATEVIVSGGKDPCQFKVTLSLNENITKESIVILYVVKNQQIEEPVVPDLTVGLSEDNPCTTSEDLLAAITNSQSGATIYIGGKIEGSGYVFPMTQTHAITKNLTIKSAVENLTVKRNSGTYIYIDPGCKLNINESVSDKTIVFTDADDTCSTNFIYDGLKGGSLVAYNAKFTNVGFGAVLVESAELYGCAFNEVSAEYGAVHISAQYSAIVDSCTFSGNTSKNADGYGDIYLAKGSEDTTLTLSGTVTTDIGIYVANESYGDPEIDVTGISFAEEKKLRIKVEKIQTTPEKLIYLFNHASFQMYPYMTFSSNGDVDEYAVNDFENMTDPYYTMMDDNGKISVHYTL